MRAFEDFKVGDIMEFGPHAITAADIKSFATRFDPQPMHLDEASAQNTVVGGLLASGLHTACLHMRLFAEGVLRDSTSMGSPGVEEVRYLAPVRAGDTVNARVTITDIVPAKRKVTLATVCTVGERVVLEGEAVVMVPARPAS